MKVIFTLCSNNYLAQALVLAKSAMLYQPQWKFVIGLVDTKSSDIYYEGFNCEVIEVETVEPTVNALAEKYSIIELNTCVKPRFFQYFFEHYKAEQVIYLDPDTCIYYPMTELDELLQAHDFVITPHILTPIPLDNHTPGEPLFLNYGLYNLGFLALRKSGQTLSFLQWWKDRTYQKGYDRPAAGLFTDQLWINLVPLYFSKVAILRHAGYNMAPWNLHERVLDGDRKVKQGDTVAPLTFYHFSGYDPAKPLLHKDYTRFQLHQRPDLIPLYGDYKAKLENEQYYRYKTFSCHYVTVRNNYLQLQALAQKEYTAMLDARLPLSQKLVRRVKRLMPGSMKRFAVKLIRS